LGGIEKFSIVAISEDIDIHNASFYQNRKALSKGNGAVSFGFGWTLLPLLTFLGTFFLETT